MKASRFAVAVGIFLSAFALNTQATTYYADATLGNNSYDGLSSMVSGGDGPKFNILSAIVISSNGDSISAATGSYQEYLWDSGTNSVTLNPQGNVTVDAVDAFEVDSIGDGIADGWRLEYFGSGTTTNSSSCATCDPDGDSYNNLQEYTLFTDPTNSASFPAFMAETNRVTSAPIINWEFADSFNAATSTLSIFPTNHTFFLRTTDSIAISNADGGVVDVWNVKGGRVYRGAAPGFTNSLSPGHYFVESKSDRLQFCVLPVGYTDAPGWGADPQPTYADYYAYNNSAGIRNLRYFCYWWNITQPTNTWGEYQFDTCGLSQGCGGGLDDFLAEAISLTNNLILQFGFWPSFATNPADCSLARYLTYITDVCTHIAGIPGGSNVVTSVTLWNEPWYQNTPFNFSVPDFDSNASPNYDWDWSGEPFNGTPTTFTHWLTAMYTNAVPIIRALLPNAKIYGVSANDWDVGLSIQTNLLVYGALNQLDGISHHYYTDEGRPDEAIPDGNSTRTNSLEQWIDLLKANWPTNNSLFCMDEYAVDGNFLSVGSTKSVMGITELADDGSSYLVGKMDWWNGYCDMTKDAVIFASRGVLPIFHEGLTGYHTTNSYEEALDGFAAGATSLTRGPYPRISAWTAVQHQLKGFPFVSQATSTNGIINYTFASGSSTNVFRWCIRGASANLPSALDCKDVFGNTEHTALITDEPLIFSQ